jgi:hypothetical protein
VLIQKERPIPILQVCAVLIHPIMVELRGFEPLTSAERVSVRVG